MAVATRTKRPGRRVSVLEYARTDNAHRVDLENGIIYRVKVLGENSTNGRTYPRSVRRAALPMYEGVRVFIGHPPRSAPDMERSPRDLVGTLLNCVDEEDSIIADLHILESSPEGQTVLELAQKADWLIGLSHNAVTYQAADPISGRIICTGIEKVRSVDVVCRPATSSSLFEEEQNMDDPMLSPTDDATEEGDDVATDNSDPIKAKLIEKIKTILDGPGSAKEKAAKAATLMAKLLGISDSYASAMADDDTTEDDDSDPEVMESNYVPSRRLGRRPARVNYSDPAAIARALLSPPPPESMPLTAFESQGKFRRVKPDADRYDDPKKCAQLLTSR
jgi:hypothetical protein